MAPATVARTEVGSEEKIQRDVLAELKWDARLQPNEIGVIVKDGIVTLTGTVDSYFKKWAAEDAAHRVGGVKVVANDIEVRLPSFAERTDTDIAAAVVRAHRTVVRKAHRDAFARGEVTERPLSDRSLCGSLQSKVG